VQFFFQIFDVSHGFDKLEAFENSTKCEKCFVTPKSNFMREKLSPIENLH